MISIPMMNMIINGNSGENGGGISVFNSNISIATSTISNNISTWNAGGIYINTEGDIQLIDNNIINNIAANDGGGIVSSISGVRNASKDALAKRLGKRMDRIIENGTTTVEAKSGYGLDTDSELNSLSVIDKVNSSHSIDIVPTFMGAHAYPSEFSKDHKGYIKLICDEMIPAVSEQGIAQFNDVFCEKNYTLISWSQQ